MLPLALLAVTLDQVPSIQHFAERTRAERLAFLEAAAGNRPAALAYLPKVIGKPWIGDVPFADAQALAELLTTVPGCASPWSGVIKPTASPNPDRSTDSRCQASPERITLRNRLLIASVRRHPSAALRSLIEDPDIFAEAARQAPDEACTVASGNTPAARDLRQLLKRSQFPEVRLLADCSQDDSLSLDARARLAVLHREVAAGRLTLASARHSAQSSQAHFAQVIDARLQADGEYAAALDRYLESRATELCRQESPAGLRRWPPRDVFLLLAYARPEEYERFFPAIYDATLINVRRQDLLDQTRGLRLRHFLSTALAESRFDDFLRPAPAAILKLALTGVTTLDQALLAAEIVTAAPAHLVAQELARHEGEHYQLLTAMQVRRDAAAQLNLPGPTIVERHLFWDDQDGVESYGSFRAELKSWTITDHNGWIHAAKSQNGRTIEIYANIPIDLLDPKNATQRPEAARRRADLERHLSHLTLKPSILVHRGHAYHVENSIQLMNPTHQLVFLGSCRGLRDVPQVLDAAPNAQVLVTRGIGTQGINDPLLTALHNHLLSSGHLNWPAFWSTVTARLAGRVHFAGYIPPDRNPIAIYLRAWYTHLDAVASHGR
ncbi:MAG: hypothetical protein IT168_03385 [Bryobacterales bacterium]|nr:hypothetical protein [Bryobacterales bacterium]